MEDFFNRTYFNNTIGEYLTVAGLILASVTILTLVKRIIISRIKSAARKSGDSTFEFIVSGVERFGLPIILFSVIYSGITFLTLAVKVREIVDVAGTVIITYYVIRLISSTIMQWLRSRISREEHAEQKIKQLGGLMFVINIFIWIIGIIFLLENFDQDVSAIIAGLGIGGIAIALAAQNILGDLFNYFVIYFDKPFEVGDFIIFDDKLGTVEYLGIKTTRIRCLSGEQLIIGNSALTSARVHNYKRMYERRVVFNLNIDYRTPLEKVKLAPQLIRSIIEQQPHTRFDRSHFFAYGDWALRIETVYYVLSPDYNVYADSQQAINIRIHEEFSKHEIYFVTGFHMQLAPQSQPNPALYMRVDPPKPGA